jgi:hypothetical protein
MQVRLKRAWPGPFRRSVRIDGKPVSILEWNPGDVMEVTDETELAAIKDDIGKALEVMREPVTLAAPDEPPAAEPEPPPTRRKGRH